MLARTREAPDAGEPVRLTTFGGQGVRPGVDLDDSAGLLELMETRRSTAASETGL